MRILTIVVFLILLLPSFLMAQGQRPQGEGPRAKITGKVIDKAANVAVPYANIILYRQNDSTLITGTITNEDGTFNLDVPTFGAFRMQVDFIGYKPQVIAGIVLRPDKPIHEAGTIYIQQDAIGLGEVEVTGERSQVQLGIDKRVINVDADLTNMGGSAIDVLQNVPSVTVDPDGVVSLRGSENVRILIDGRPTALSREAALATIPASQIDRIEIITNPSARYESEGMAGIINIILKKQKQPGYNGLFTLNAGTGHKYNFTANMNYGIGKLNLFGSYDARYHQSIGTWNSYRTTWFNDTLSSLSQEMEWDNKSFSNSFRLGADYRINDRNIIGVSSLYRLSNSNGESMQHNNFLDFTKTPYDYYIREADEFGNNNTFDNNLNYTRNFSQAGRQLVFDFSNSSNNNSDENQIIQYGETNGTLALTQVFRNNNSFGTTNAQADYVHPIGENGKFETGLRTTIRTSDQELDVVFLNGENEWENDPAYSNRFVHQSDVHAGYLIFSNNFKKIGYQLGVRSELTNTFSELKNTGEAFDKDYFHVFPSAHITREFTGRNRVQLSYSSRINRPSARQINPFMGLTDPLNIRMGNPDLDPEITHSFEANHMKFWKTTTLSSGIYYRYTEDVMRRHRWIEPDGISYMTFLNFGNSQSYGTEFSVNQQFNSWWRANINFNFFRRIIDGGTLGPEFKSDDYGWNTRMNNNFTLRKGTDMQLMFSYRSAMETHSGRIKPFINSDIAFRQEILQGKGNLSLRLSDIFNTMQFSMEDYGRGYESTMTRKWESRVLYLGFNYRLNNYKARERERRSMPTEDMDFD